MPEHEGKGRAPTGLVTKPHQRPRFPPIHAAIVPSRRPRGKAFAARTLVGASLCLERSRFALLWRRLSVKRTEERLGISMSDAPKNLNLPQAKPNKAGHAMLKFMVELGPLLVFFYANSRPESIQSVINPLFVAFDYIPSALFLQKPIFLATLVFMAAMTLSLIASLIWLRHVPVMPLVSGLMVLIFGGLTVWFADDIFIKIKPTVVNALFGTALLVGARLGKPLLKIVLDTVLQLDEEGWRILSLRWGCFFYVLAVINECVWRTQPDDVWINFKVFGIMPLTFVFAMAQAGLINRHQIKAEEQSESF